MIVFKDNKLFQPRSDKPNENWLEETEIFVVEDGSELAKKIEEYAPYYNFVVDETGELVDITPTERPPEPPKPPTDSERIAALEETLNAMLGL